MVVLIGHAWEPQFIEDLYVPIVRQQSAISVRSQVDQEMFNV